MRKKKEKIAIVMSGGGMQCAYGAGVLVALAEHYKLVEPDMLIAPSGSAASAVYYVAEQYQKLAVMWLAFSTDPRFISVFKQPIVDIDYFIEVIKKKLPFDLKKLAKSRTRLFMPVVRAKDGKLVFLKTRPDKEVYSLVHATLAAPFIYGKKVTVRGHAYIDGAYGPTVHDYLTYAVEAGATKIILIRNRADSYTVATRLLMRGLASNTSLLRQYKSYATATRKALENSYLFVPPKSVELVTIVPQKKMPLSLLGGSKMDYRITFDAGYDDAVNHPKLEEMLTKKR